jgi:phosphatidylserine decarboxylase
MKIAREGYPYILILFLIGIPFLILKIWWAAAIFFVLTAFVAFFFRDPDRYYQGAPGEVVSPADGKVVLIRKEGDQEVLSIFLSVFDVHINRAPVGGKVTSVEYHKGKFLAAWDERASIENERNSITMDHQGVAVRFVQIAGLIARRIVCWIQPGAVLQRGDRIGLIKFGSRVDVLLPPGSKWKVKSGQRVKGGETVIGELP